MKDPMISVHWDRSLVGRCASYKSKASILARLAFLEKTLVSPSVGRRIPTFADDVNFDRPLLAIVGESRNYLAVNSRRNTAFNAQINTSNFPVENPTGEVGNLWKGLPTASCWINSGFLHLSTRDQVCEISVILTHVKIHIWIPCQNLNFK